jgi:uncharacterized protein YgiM (DUF1202 family)
VKRLLYLLLLVLFIQVVLLADPAQISKNDKLRIKPFIDSKIVSELKAGQKVDIQKRQGSWYFIALGKTTGWTPMLSVHRTTPAATATTGSVATTATGRSATGKITTTTGVRGLNEDTLSTATFSEEAVAAVEQHRITSADAAAFAAAGDVQLQIVPPLVSSKTTGVKK